MLETIQYYITLPITELLAVFFSLAYVILAAKNNNWCWPAAFVSTFLYTILFYEVFLWMDSLLHIYYMVMAFYGWYCWRKKTENTTHSQMVVKQYKTKIHIIAIGCLTVLSVVVGYFMDRFTPTDFPYIDSATTVFAVFTTYLVTQKVIENWLYWIVIDAVSIYVYFEKGLEPTAYLFVFYTLIAVYGYFSWQKSYDENNACADLA